MLVQQGRGENVADAIRGHVGDTWRVLLPVHVDA